MPMRLHFKDYNETEKIADPPKTLSKENAPEGFAPKPGDLAVYGPWGNVSVFYKEFRYSKGLIPMGHFISGLENLAGMNGEFDAKVEVVSKE
ncbi:cyclophilin-like fold protein [Sporomusa acidovorans]|nr:cyclophilin-like fold protein [Sporomusa acidovorans]